MADKLSQPRDATGQFMERTGRRPVTAAKAEGRHILFRNSTTIVNAILTAIRIAKSKGDYQVAGSLAIQAAQFIMPKLQAVAHVSPNTAIDFLQQLRQELIEVRKALPSGSPPFDTSQSKPIEAEYKEVPSVAPKTAQDKQGMASEQGVCPIPHSVAPANIPRSVPAPAPKPFSELTREEIKARYKV